MFYPVEVDAGQTPSQYVGPQLPEIELPVLPKDLVKGPSERRFFKGMSSYVTLIRRSVGFDYHRSQTEPVQDNQ